MFIRAIKVSFLDGTIVEVTFQDGKVFQFDVSIMVLRFPIFRQLQENKELFRSGHLDNGGYGIIWSDELDLSAMSVYYSGQLVRTEKVKLNNRIGVLINEARNKRGISQTELAKLSGIDQGDISKIEMGLGNPTLKKINKLFEILEIDIKAVYLK